MLLDTYKNELNDLCRKYGVKGLWLFGSATDERFDPATSDVDLLVEFCDVDTMSPAAQYFDFLEELKALFGREVDLVERKAIQNPYLLAGIAGKELLLYAA